MKWAGHVARMGERRVLVWEPEEKRALGRSKLRGEGNIKMNFQEVEWEHGMD